MRTNEIVRPRLSERPSKPFRRTRWSRALSDGDDETLTAERPSQRAASSTILYYSRERAEIRGTLPDEAIPAEGVYRRPRQSASPRLTRGPHAGHTWERPPRRPSPGVRSPERTRFCSFATLASWPASETANTAGSRTSSRLPVATDEHALVESVPARRCRDRRYRSGTATRASRVRPRRRRTGVVTHHLVRVSRYNPGSYPNRLSSSAPSLRWRGGLRRSGTYRARRRRRRRWHPPRRRRRPRSPSRVGAPWPRR